MIKPFKDGQKQYEQSAGMIEKIGSPALHILNTDPFMFSSFINHQTEEFIMIVVQNDITRHDINKNYAKNS